MKALLGCVAFVALLVGSIGSASAVSVTSSTVLKNGLTDSKVVAAPAPYAGTSGTLKVTATGNFPFGIAIFSALDSFNIGTVRRADSVGPFVPGAAGTLTKTFSIDSITLASILNNGFVDFKVRSASATALNQYSVTSVLSYATVPEPTSMAILGLGAFGAVALRRRKKLTA